MSPLYLIIICVYPAILLLTIIALVRNWGKSKVNDFKNNDELSAWMILLGAFFTTLAPIIGFLRYDAFGSDKPFDPNHVISVEVLVVVSGACYWISKFFKRKLSPFINQLLRAALLQGIILDAIVTLHFANYLMMGIVFPLFGFELLAPPMALIFIWYELECNYRVSKPQQESANAVGKNILVQFGWVAALVVVEQVMLMPAGFAWDSLISAFTESKGFILSSGYHHFR